MIPRARPPILPEAVTVVPAAIVSISFEFFTIIPSKVRVENDITPRFFKIIAQEIKPRQQRISIRINRVNHMRSLDPFFGLKQVAHL